MPWASISPRPGRPPWGGVRARHRGGLDQDRLCTTPWHPFLGQLVDDRQKAAAVQEAEDARAAEEAAAAAEAAEAAVATVVVAVAAAAVATVAVAAVAVATAVVAAVAEAAEAKAGEAKAGEACRCAAHAAPTLPLAWQ